MLEDLRGVERWRGLHSKRVGVRNHGSFPRRTERRHAAINQLLDFFLSRRTEMTVGLVGLLRIVCRAQGISEKLKTVLSKFSKKVIRGHRTVSLTVANGACCSALCGYRRRTSATRCASHRTLKKSSAAHHTAIVSRIRTDRLR